MLIKDNKLVEIVDVLFATNTIILKEYETLYPNSTSTLTELPINLFTEYEVLKPTFTVVGEDVLSQIGYTKEADYVVTFPVEPDFGWDYKYRFFFTDSQFTQAFLSYPEVMVTLTQEPVNPILPLSNGKLIYVNNFVEGFRELLESNGIKIDTNPNITE